MICAFYAQIESSALNNLFISFFVSISLISSGLFAFNDGIYWEIYFGRNEPLLKSLNRTMKRSLLCKTLSKSRVSSFISRIFSIHFSEYCLLCFYSTDLSWFWQCFSHLKNKDNFKHKSNQHIIHFSLSLSQFFFLSLPLSFPLVYSHCWCIWTHNHTLIIYI